ncbi:hypothetical protein [Zavarzinia sp.]|uniref:hypothetical protein n=1 Tax=Zavarzinia sp. TaxID=2027920 RepID=UPI003BB4C27B
MIEDLIDHSDPETRVSAIDEISKLAPQVPRDLIAAAVGGDIPAALAAVEAVFPGHHLILGKGRYEPEDTLYGASIWPTTKPPGRKQICRSAAARWIPVSRKRSWPRSTTP